MTYMLDTNICIGLLNGTLSETLSARILGLQPADFVLSAVSVAELYFGARKSARVDYNLSRVSTFVEPFAIAPFDQKAAHHYGMIRTTLERAGTPIGANDLLIAASALSLDACLMTKNVGEFSRVPGLRVYAE
ncbi:MAG: type II toxin-antitoxin system VapC family toxin [Myxococcales bacterium]|nr:type II toxin-antitoxin system VapC family toxin [Myxococcales bacterium]